ncbi:Hsp70 family protein [Escherichia coli]
MFIEPLKVALQDAGLSVSDIDDVILVGGQTDANGSKESC